MKHKPYAQIGWTLALLSAAAGAAEPPTKPPATAVAAAPQSSTAARTAAQHKVDAILRSGRLTAEDVSQLRTLLDAMPVKEALAFRIRIAEAINARTITPTQHPLDLP